MNPKKMESLNAPAVSAARGPALVFFAISLVMACACFSLWIFWPAQTSWLIRGAGIGMLVMAVLFLLVLVSPSLSEKLEQS